MIFDAEAYAEGICNSAAGSTIEVLVMQLEHAAEACDYAADDLAERADFERKHQGASAPDDEEREYRESAEAYTDTASKLRELVKEIETREHAMRDEEDDGPSPTDQDDG